MEPLVVVVEDAETGSRVEHRFARSPVRIGRASLNELVLDREFVSSWHGVIDFDERGARYLDLGSAPGTLLDGAPAPPRTPVAVSAATTLTLGTLRLRFPPRSAAIPAVPAAGPGAAPPAPEPPVSVRPGSITALMRKLAAAPEVAPEAEWQRALYPGAVIGRFELLREIGRGSFGRVYEARDTKLNRLVAFKAVLPGRQSQVRLRQDRLEREAEAVAQLSHPNIVTLFDAGTGECGPYLVFELLKGETLHARVARGRLPLVEAIDIAIEVAFALDHAHSAGICHRDLKPANVFLCAEGVVKVLDFGIAHAFGAGDQRLLGTPAYMAPEQWREAQQDARADVFGAAAMLFESVTGRLPYEVTASSSSALEPGARPRVSDPSLPLELKALLRRALAVDPARRPENGDAWLRALIAVRRDLEAEEGGHSMGRARFARRRPRARQRKRRILLAAAGTAAALAGLAALAYALLVR